MVVLQEACFTPPSSAVRGGTSTAKWVGTVGFHSVGPMDSVAAIAKTLGSHVEGSIQPELVGVQMEDR